VEQFQSAPTQISEEQQQRQVTDLTEQDALARAAGEVVEALREEQNPKFKNSRFMGLMRSLADRTSVVEGKDIIPTPSVPVDITSAISKGKGKERASTISTSGQTTQVYPYSANVGVTSGGQLSPLFHTQGQMPNITIASNLTQASDEVYEYFKQENEDYIAHQRAASRVYNNLGLWDDSSQQYEWDKLQGEWDAWEANAVGVRKMSNYQFAAENPYVLGSSTRAHEMHSSFDQVGIPGTRITGTVDSDTRSRRSERLTSGAVADEHPGTRSRCPAGSQERPSVVRPGCEAAGQRTGAEGYRGTPSSGRTRPGVRPVLVGFGGFAHK